MIIKLQKIGFILILLIFTANLTLAADPGIVPFDPNLVGTVATNAGYVTENVGPTTLAATLGTLVFGLLSFLGVVFISLMVYGGYRWLTARGNEQNIDEAKKIIRNAIIGTTITIAAYGIWQLIETYVL
jgi:cytochrome bd-type quinol oxidase subunit 2